MKSKKLLKIIEYYSVRLHYEMTHMYAQAYGLQIDCTNKIECTNLSSNAAFSVWGLIMLMVLPYMKNLFQKSVSRHSA